MRITAVTTAMPGPQKPRLLGFIRVLTAAGHDVSVVATADLSLGGGAKADEQGHALMKQMGVPVTQVPFTPSPLHLARSTISVALRRRSSETALYDSQRLAEQFAVAIEATRPDVVHVDRVRAVPLIRTLAVPFVVDLTDPRLATYRLYRAARARDPARVALAETLRAWLDQGPAVREETTALAGIPVLVASGIGHRSLVDAGADGKLVWDVPNPVFSDERSEPLAQPPRRPPVIGMSGNLSYPPNVLGFNLFAKKVVPSLNREIGARIVLIGSSPHRLLVRRAKRVGAEIHSDVHSVPETIHELGVSVMLSPQTISAGFPNRIIDAAYRAGVPTVASPETIRGIPEQLAASVPAASTPEEWTRQIRALLTEDGSRDLVVELQDGIERVCGAGTVSSALTAAYEHAMSMAEPRGR